jgi:hypothetical protein
MRALIALVMMVGCGGGEGEALSVDDYVPESVRAQYVDLPEHVVTCVRSQYVGARRIVDCSNDVQQVRFVEEQLTAYDYVAHCAEMDDDPLVWGPAASCLDTWANADCGELEGPPAPCRMAESWGPPGD